MTLAQLMAIYNASLGVGETEAIEAVYLTGYYAGKGTAPPSNPTGAMVALAAPTNTVTLTKPDLR